MKAESFRAENTDEIVRLRLNRLKSVKLCEKLLQAKNKGIKTPLSDEVIKSKSIGLSSAIESALGYLDQGTVSLNSKVLSRYYFMLQLTIAEQVAKVNNQDDLKSVQKHTEQGHGLGTIRDSSKKFPEDYYTFTLKGGHFYSYLKSIGANPKEFSLDRRPRKFDDITEFDKLVNIDDLFRRIPELNNVVEEYTGKPPLSFHIGYSPKNTENNLEAVKEHIRTTGEFVLQAPKTEQKKTSIISFHENTETVNPEFLQSLGLPFYDYSYSTDSLSGDKTVESKLDHDTKYWHQAIETYSSGYSPTCIIAPMWSKVSDPIIVNFTLLYTLSIIVRYLPDLWYEISSGELNHYGSLIEYYIAILDHTIPLQMLERITESEINIHQPGSFFGPM